MADDAGGGAGASYIGAHISLTSKSEIRYEGILYSVDTENSNIALQNVRSYGTEGRKKGGPEIPPSDKVYDYIIFRGSDIKDLQVISSPALHSQVPNDPAIVSSYAQPPQAPAPVADGQPGHAPAAPHAIGQTQQPYAAPAGPLPPPPPGPPPQHIPSAQPQYPPPPYQQYPPGAADPYSRQGLPPPQWPQQYYRGPPGVPTQQIQQAPPPPPPSAPQKPSAPPAAVVAPAAALTIAAAAQPPVAPPAVSPTAGQVPQGGPKGAIVGGSALPPPASESVSVVVTPAAPQKAGAKRAPAPTYQKLAVPPLQHTAVVTAPAKAVVTPPQGQAFQQHQQKAVPKADEKPSESKELLTDAVSSLPASAPQAPSAPILPSPVAPTQQPLLPLPAQKPAGPQRPGGRGGRGNMNGNYSNQMHQGRGGRHGRGRGLAGGRGQVGFVEDFDFSAMNEKFNKEEVWGELSHHQPMSPAEEANQEPEAVEDGALLEEAEDSFSAEGHKDEKREPMYNKDDFFDTLSCDALDRSSGNSNRLRMFEQRKVDIETFGNELIRSGRGRGRGGRGYGGYGRGRGGRGGYGGYGRSNYHRQQGFGGGPGRGSNVRMENA